MQNGGMGADNTNGGLGTANYTLPGIMQYLQSQFTQVERNRLQSELERSSLKLKIIELENDRNMLIRQNEKLKTKVSELQIEIAQLKDAKNTDIKDKNKDNLDTEIVNSIHSIDVSKLIHAKKFLKNATNEILYLLKTPTAEISNSLSEVKNNDSELFFNYQSQSPRAENQNEVGWKPREYSLKSTGIDQMQNSNSPNISKSEIEKQLNDIITGQDKSALPESDSETIVEEPETAAKKINCSDHSSVEGDGKNDDHDDDADDDDDDDDDDDEFDDDDFDDDDDDDEDDDDDDDDEDDDDDDDDEDDDKDVDIGNNENADGSKEKLNHNNAKRAEQHSKNQKGKLFTLLQRSPKKHSNSFISSLKVKLEPNLSEIEIKCGKLFTYYDKNNVFKIYDDLLNKCNLIKEIQMPEANLIIDIITTENYILVATVNTLFIHGIENDLIIKKPINNIKSVDLEENRVLLALNNKIEILEINLTNKSFDLVNSFDHTYEGILKKVKFVQNNPSFNIVILTSTILVFYNSNTKKPEIFKTLPLNQYQEWLITSKILILKFDKGLFLFDFSECSVFKSIPLPIVSKAADSSGLISEVISSCVDDDTMFCISRYSYAIDGLMDEKLTQNYEVRLFKIDIDGTIKEVSVLKDIRHDERYCVGKLSNELAIFVARGKEIQVHNINNL